jgi:hypothetical protein
MPISNKSSQKRMTETTIRIDPNEASKRQQGQNTQRKAVILNDNANNNYQTVGIDANRNTENIFMFLLEYISNR